MIGKLGRRTKIKQDQQRLDVPSGQYVTEKFPVLTFGPNPRIDMSTWQFRVFGLVDPEVTLDWEEFKALGKTTIEAPFHCVTQWSKMENAWEGVPFSAVMDLITLQPDSTHVMVHCYGGYTTNLALDVVQDENVLFAYRHDSEPLSEDHGGPLRLVVPKRYGWKSAKWVNGLEFMNRDTPGFWEERGYHMNGDPLKEERFWDEQG